MRVQIKKAGLVWALLLLIGGAPGCATMLATMNWSGVDPDAARESNYHNTPILTDFIFAVGQPNEASLKKLDNPHAIAFLGDKNTYLLLAGGETLIQIAKKLNIKSITMNPETTAIISSGLYLKNNTIWGSLYLEYFRKDRNYSDEEISKLVELGFSSCKTKSGAYITFTKRILIKGIVYPAAHIPSDQVQSLNRHYAIPFYNPPDSSPPPDYKKISKIVSAITIDVITFPIQALGFLGLTIFAITLN